MSEQADEVQEPGVDPNGAGGHSATIMPHLFVQSSNNIRQKNIPFKFNRMPAIRHSYNPSTLEVYNYFKSKITKHHIDCIKNFMNTLQEIEDA